MQRRKFPETGNDVIGGFSHNFEIPDYRSLRFFIGQKSGLIDVFDIPADPENRVVYMPEIIRETRIPRLTHSGSAPATTSPRKLSGRAFGVSTSTVTPSSCFASWRIAAISSKVVSGVGSTSRSRSLASVSFPDNTDPNRRGLRTRYRSTKARSASRFRLSDSDGLMAKWYRKDTFPCYGVDDDS
jgi:hypothetical protein